MLERSLQKLGLTEKEAQMYLQLLEIGMQPASVLAKKLKTPRSTAQFLCNNLVEKQFARKKLLHGITYYHGETPEVLKSIFEGRKSKLLEEWESEKDQLEVITPLLNQIADPESYLPKVTFFEGIEEFAESQEEFLKGIPDGSEIYSYTFPASIEQLKIRNAVIDFMHARLKKNIFIKTIAVFSPDAVKLQLTDQYYQRETLLTYKNPEDTIIAETLLYDSKVFDISYSEKGVFSSLIVNRDIGKMRRYMFDMAWKQAIHDNKTLQNNPQFKEWSWLYRNSQEY